jgi:hypothetical protein
MMLTTSMPGRVTYLLLWLLVRYHLSMLSIADEALPRLAEVGEALAVTLLALLSSSDKPLYAVRNNQLNMEAPFRLLASGDRAWISRVT